MPFTTNSDYSAAQATPFSAGSFYRNHAKPPRQPTRPGQFRLDRVHGYSTPYHHIPNPKQTFLNNPCQLIRNLLPARSLPSLSKMNIYIALHNPTSWRNTIRSNISTYPYRLG
ncbi:hypothetical protein DSO57_1032536 [Entomophthora muscae]|uniref:Uncharacterized protein n=1 Tax=Entomophthora muscae TaxID=34485 RepID=A0ACC2UA67_9FUNG|nr:hypothetical protein DSO57_1032536 [Entomophthora muscae]